MHISTTSLAGVGLTLDQDNSCVRYIITDTKHESYMTLKNYTNSA